MNYVKLSKKISACILLTGTVTVSGLLIFPILPISANSSQICNNPPGGQKGDTSLDSKSATVQSFVLKIQLRYRNSTREKWVRGCMPSGTSLYLKDRKGNVYGQYTAGVHGWNYADKIRLNAPVQACAKHPDDSRQFCTGFF